MVSTNIFQRFKGYYDTLLSVTVLLGVGVVVRVWPEVIPLHYAWLCPHRLLTVTIHTWPTQYRAVQRQTAVTTYFTSQQLLLFVLHGGIQLYICVEFTRASSLSYSPQLTKARQIKVAGSILGGELQFFVCWGAWFKMYSVILWYQDLRGQDNWAHPHPRVVVCIIVTM